MSSDDAELVRRAREGSEEAYRALLERYQRPVFSVIVRMVRDRELAEDLTQETFLKAFRSLASFDPRRRLSSWLFTIAHNATIDDLRRRRVATVPLESDGEGIDPLHRVPAASGTPEAASIRRDLASAFERELRRLRPEYAEVLVLRFQEGLAYEEIAAVTGLPLGTVKTHLHRARKTLAARLAEAGWRPGDGGR